MNNKNNFKKSYNKVTNINDYRKKKNINNKPIPFSQMSQKDREETVKARREDD
jgi:hypothetical protein